MQSFSWGPSMLCCWSQSYSCRQQQYNHSQRWPSWTPAAHWPVLVSDGKEPERIQSLSTEEEIMEVTSGALLRTSQGRFFRLQPVWGSICKSLQLRLFSFTNRVIMPLNYADAVSAEGRNLRGNMEQPVNESAICLYSAHYTSALM